jgi:hypothetical protein
MWLTPPFATQVGKEKARRVEESGLVTTFYLKNSRLDRVDTPIIFSS